MDVTWAKITHLSSVPHIFSSKLLMTSVPTKQTRKMVCTDMCNWWDWDPVRFCCIVKGFLNGMLNQCGNMNGKSFKPIWGHPLTFKIWVTKILY